MKIENRYVTEMSLSEYLALPTDIDCEVFKPSAAPDSVVAGTKVVVCYRAGIGSTGKYEITMSKVKLSDD